MRDDQAAGASSVLIFTEPPAFSIAATAAFDAPSTSKESFAFNSPRPSSFTPLRALRQRGLLARFDALPAISEGWNDAPDLWITANAIYEAHLRRVGMEQVMATLRRDEAENA